MQHTHGLSWLMLKTLTVLNAKQRSYPIIEGSMKSEVKKTAEGLQAAPPPPSKTK